MEVLRSKCLSPLDNDMILEIIFESLPSVELVRGRLVSKRWEEFATKLLKKRRDLVIKLNCQTIGKFTSSMENSRKPPFPCFALKCVYYGDESFRKFTQVCGDSVKTLSFDLDKIRTDIQTLGCSSCLEPLQKVQHPVEDDLLQNVILKFGNTLEVLKFRTMPFSNWNTSINVKVTFESNRSIVELYFPSYHPISRSKVEWACKDLAESCSRIFSGSRNLVIDTSDDKLNMSLLKSCGILDQVTKLSLGDSGSLDQVLYQLLDSNIALEEFDTYIDSKKISADLLGPFLKMQSKHLKVLTLGYLNTIWRNRLQLPVMSELTELNMEHRSDEGVVQFLNLDGLDLLHNLPKLNSLSFYSTCSINELVRSELRCFIWSNVPFTRLDSLKMSLLDQDVVVLALPYLGQQFPNITKLSLNFVTCKMLREVFAVADWGLNLKELKLVFRIFSRDNLNKYRDCGICDFGYKWRNGVGRKLLKDNDQGAILRAAESCSRRSRRAVGITQFPNLEKLSIKEREWRTVDRVNGVNYFISDLSIYFALVNLKSLRSLLISGQHMITAEAVKYLKENSPVLCSVVVKDFSWNEIFS